ncbi:MAG: RsiV family protein [Lachnospiraceae bacterium]|nr:RsiV family protein [Lachnospiraceae bacterium]
MKKRLLGILIISTMAMALTSCSSIFSGDNGNEADEDKDDRKYTDDEKEADDPTDTPTDTVKAPAAGSDDWLYYYGRRCFVIDDDGNEIASYDIEKLSETLSEKNGQNYNSFECYGDGILFFAATTYSDNGANTTFYGMDPVTEEYTEIYKTDPDWHMERLDYYNGKLYIDIANSGSYDEKVFEKSKDSLLFNEVTGKYADLFDKDFAEFGIQGASLLTDGCYEKRYCSYTRALDNAGFLLGNNDSGIEMITPDGNIKNLDTIDQSALIEAYDEDYIICGEYDDDYINYSLSVYDVKADKMIRPDPGDDIYRFITYLDGRVYYSVCDNTEYGHPVINVYYYDCKNDKTTLFFTQEPVPGTQIPSVADCFRIIDGKAYFMKVVDKSINWVSADPDTCEIKDTGIVVDEIHTFEFGRIEYASDTKFCPGCGIPVEKYYIEKFILDDSFKNADAVNGRLDELFESEVAYHDTDPVIEDDICEYHQEYPEQYCETDDVYISDVGLIGKDYLYVDFGGYWYGGGAHGYPDRSQVLFDLKTGKQVTFADLYGGTQEDYKKLVAEKTLEDYNSYDETDTPYFPSDEESLYEKAYEEADMNKENFEFTEDGVYLYYFPYDMGPYASGFIEVLLTYDELGFSLE